MDDRDGAERRASGIEMDDRDGAERRASGVTMRRFIGVACVALLLPTACTDDRVALVRGPLGPASYEVHVRALDQAGEEAEEHFGTLRVEPRDSGAAFEMRTPGGDTLTAEIHVASNGSVNLARIRGGVTSGQELASLVGQLNPPLPDRPVRLGRRWSRTQRITTDALAAQLTTTLRVVRFRRVASTDAAELTGDVAGQLRIKGPVRELSGRLTGTTTIDWAVRAGRMVSADTVLVWTLSDGSRVQLETSVSPR
jgi:hypothetical protein